MGFMATLKSHGAKGNKNVRAKYTKTFVAKDKDVGVVEVKLTLNTVVLDTSDEGIVEDTEFGGSIATPNGNVTYKSGDAEAVALFAEGASQALDASIAKVEARPRKRGNKADTVEVEPSANGQPA